MDINDWVYSFHGSPVDKLTQFDEKFFGQNSSEFGKGVYVTDNNKYAVSHVERMNKKPHLYAVQNPSKKYFLDYIGTFEQQSKPVQDALIKFSKIPTEQLSGKSGEDIIELAKQVAKNGEWEKYLDSIGIKGTRFTYPGKGNMKVIYNPSYAKIAKQFFSVLPINELSLIPEYAQTLDLIMTKDKGQYNKKLQKMFNDAGINYSNGQIQL